MKGWKEYRLGDLATFSQGIQVPIEDQQYSYKPGLVRFIRIKDITSNGAEPPRYITDPGSRFIVKKGDLVMIRYGSPGIVTDRFEGAIANNLFKIRIQEPAVAYRKFLFYALSPKLTQGYFLANQNSTTMPAITFAEASVLPILLPPRPEQKAIASVLSSLDDKIDLLRRQNKTLEAMAETLFRQWFVEEADDSWEERKLEDFCPIITGKKDANIATEDGEYPFFTCSQKTLKAPNWSFEGYAILLAGNGDFNVKRYIGKFEAYQRTYVLIPHDKLWFDFLYLYIKHHLSEITRGHRGSVVNFLTKGMIADRIVRLPAYDVTEQLNIFATIFTKVDNNARQIQTLERLRDTLLPKLMSGEVRVKV